MKKTLFTSWVTALAISVFSSAPARAQDQIGIQLGAKAPAATVETLAGKQINLSKYIGKTPVFLEFWATWCSNCKALEPQLLSVVKRYSPRVTFVSVAVSANQSPERIKKYIEKYHYTHDVLYDRTGAAVTAYDVPATSYIVAINKAGKVVYTGLGAEQNLENVVKKSLAQ